MTTRSWQAWLDTEPPAGAQLHVRGICTTPTAGWTAALTPRAPQGSGTSRLLLDLVLNEPSGTVAQVETDMEVHYQQPAAPGQYEEVTVFCPEPVRIAIHEVS